MEKLYKNTVSLKLINSNDVLPLTLEKMEPFQPGGFECDDYCCKDCVHGTSMDNCMIASCNKKYDEEKKKYLDALDRNKCMLCGYKTRDTRHLFVDCFAEMKYWCHEMISINGLGYDDHKKGYVIIICKRCRGDFQAMVGQWAVKRKQERNRSVSPTYPDLKTDEDEVIQSNED